METRQTPDSQLVLVVVLMVLVMVLMVLMVLVVLRLLAFNPEVLEVFFQNFSLRSSKRPSAFFPSIPSRTRPPASPAAVHVSGAGGGLGASRESADLHTLFHPQPGGESHGEAQTSACSPTVSQAHPQTHPAAVL